jgi:hypothetical protein
VITTDQSAADLPVGGVRAVGRLPLLIGFFAGPAIWSLHEVVSEFLVADACSTGTSGFNRFTLLGAPGWQLVLLLLTGLLAALVVGADVIAYRAWRQTGIGTRVTGVVGGAAGRSGWMALAGILMSSLFLIAILFGGASIFWLSGCS